MPAGRPKVTTPKIIEKLTHAFAIGATDEEACSYADISPATLYNYQIEHPEFLEEKDRLKLKPILKAKNNIILALEDKEKGLDTAKWYLERKKKDEFSLKQLMEHSGEIKLPTPLLGENNVSNNNSDTETTETE